MAAAMHAQGQLTPEEMQAIRTQAAQQNGQEDYRPPPRPAVDIQALQAERATLRLVEQAPQVIPPGSVQYPQVLQRTDPGQRYHLPLSRQVSAEIVIHGSPTTADFKLLQRYVRLMSSADFAVVAPPESPPPQVAPLVLTRKRPPKHAESP
jgi:hypothetical protein